MMNYFLFQKVLILFKLGLINMNLFKKIIMDLHEIQF